MRDDGSIWALSSRGAFDVPPGVIGTFDVFDPEGRFVRQVTLRGAGDYWEDRYVFSRGFLYVITNVGEVVSGWHRPGGRDRGEEAPREIICYRLPD